MPDPIVTLTIDGMEVSVPKGTTLIEAAKHAGVVVPHYCYHPSLPSPAVCRMCLVEVEKLPKLVPACVTAAGEGQVVHVHSEQALKAREGVLEFLLINHPLDCPICDQSGECELQDFVFQEGRSASRYADYPKRYNPVEDFGPDILYIPNRCILCTRCVRFMDDVAEESIINVSERGDRAYIGIDSSRKLDHEWAGNVVDLCPVGSLVSKDFLHKARAWDLDKTASICTGCNQGCNIMIDTRDDVVVRLRPRPNLEVNQHFICDTGRADYRWMNRGDRLEQVLVASEGQLSESEWEPALERIATLVASAGEQVVLLVGGRASAESIGWTMKMLDDHSVMAAMKVPEGPEVPLKGIPNLALRKERAANLRAAELLGLDAQWDAAVAASTDAALVVVLDAELTDQEAQAVGAAKSLIHLATVRDLRLDSAQVVAPVTNMAEEQGVYINRDNRAQRFLPARTPRGAARPAWWVAAGAWALAKAERIPPATASEAFAQLPESGGARHQDLGFVGKVLEGSVVGGMR